MAERTPYPSVDRSTTAMIGQIHSRFFRNILVCDIECPTRERASVRCVPVCLLTRGIRRRNNPDTGVIPKAKYYWQASVLSYKLLTTHVCSYFIQTPDRCPKNSSPNRFQRFVVLRRLKHSCSEDGPRSGTFAMGRSQGKSQKFTRSEPIVARMPIFGNSGAGIAPRT